MTTVWTWLLTTVLNLLVHGNQWGQYYNQWSPAIVQYSAVKYRQIWSSYDHFLVSYCATIKHQLLKYATVNAAGQNSVTRHWNKIHCCTDHAQPCNNIQTLHDVQCVQHRSTSVLTAKCPTRTNISSTHGCMTVAALHQGAPGQMTWLEDPPPWLKPCLLLCFGNSVNRK